MRSEAFERRLEEARAFGRACNDLPDRFPDLSAKGGLSEGQRAGLNALVGAALVFLVVQPLTLGAAIITFLSAVFGLIVLLRLMATISALFATAAAAPPRTPDADLPVLTILVALYDEADVAPALIDAIGRLDYPASRLDVKLLVEADDDATIDAIREAQPPGHFEVLPVPPGQPRTKPKALNYGLAYARGGYVAVFDAEDRPAPGQPREAIAAFRSGPKNLAVVQAPLSIHNGDESWLAAQFEIEYAIHFRIWLPFLARLRMPLALGGTSNYFCRKRLEEAGGWDAWNVTEDADLGIRLARFGGAASTITSPTREEAPARLKHWMKQRTRWMKGHLQTLIVATRHPWQAARGMGIGNFLSVLLTLGGSLLASMVHAPLMIWIVAGMFVPALHFESWHAALFGVAYGGVIAAAIAARAERVSLLNLLTLPLYWPLLSWAMLWAMIQIRTRPHFWAKTPHGAKARKR